MIYHLSQNGRELGAFPLAELRRRRDAGELTGQEHVWAEGMAQWQLLDAVLQSNSSPTPPKFIAPPPLPPDQKRKIPSSVSALIIFGGALFLGAAIFAGVEISRAVRQATDLRTASVGRPLAQPAALQAASKPIAWDSNTRTAADVLKTKREFRVRQYIAGYQLHSDRKPEYDMLALGFLTNWISCNYGGPIDTNLPSLSEIGDRLAADPACQEPLLLTVSGLNCIEMHEKNRRLERAVQAFENSKYEAYPKFFATVTLSDELLDRREDRIAELDAKAMDYLRQAFKDSSFQSGDDEILARILLDDWGYKFFYRNEAAVCSLVQAQGQPYEWLALTLTGENKIDAAWRERGNGFADSVSTAGWKGFEARLAEARESLTRAWQLHPERPEASGRMIYVSLGDSDIGEMRKWFDRSVKAQLDYQYAWTEMRWGLRPRWYGDYDSMLALGRAALRTRRFDTDVPRMFFDSVIDVEGEMKLPGGQRLFGRADIWPDMQTLYAGYIAEPTVASNSRAGWRTAYTVIAYLAGKYDTARTQLEALNWQPQAWNLDNWNRDITMLPQEVAARTGTVSAQINDAEQWREGGNVAEALLIYTGLSTNRSLDTLTAAFVQERLTTLTLEKRFAAGDWVNFLPTDTNFTGWFPALGDFHLQPDGALEVKADEQGHIIYSRARLGTEVEMRGQFEVVSTTTKDFQAGVVMGLPQYAGEHWYAFRMKRTKDEGEIASFSRHWSPFQITSPVRLDDHTNTFDLRFHLGQLNATVNGVVAFNRAQAPPNTYVNTNEFFLGLGAFNNNDTTVIRYRHVQVRKFQNESLRRPNTNTDVQTEK